MNIESKWRVGSTQGEGQGGLIQQGAGRASWGGAVPKMGEREEEDEG